MEREGRPGCNFVSFQREVNIVKPEKQRKGFFANDEKGREKKEEN